MNIINLLRGLLEDKIEIDKKYLPSMGLFYPDDFKIFIKKADIEDVIRYEQNYVSDSIGVVIDKIKTLVKNNITLSKNYTFSDIRSIDIVYIFFEIVKATKGESVYFVLVDSEKKTTQSIEFGKDTFNYFNIPDELMKKYNKEDKYFLIDGYKYTKPSIGVEDSLTNFLIKKYEEGVSEEYNSYFYDFTHFLHGKNSLTMDEVENLVTIFNDYMEPSELEKVKKIVDMFSPMIRYSLKKDGKIIEMNSSMNLEMIWR